MSMSRVGSSALHVEDRRGSFTTGRCRRLAPPRPRPRWPGHLGSGRLSLSMSDSARLPRRIHQSFPVHRCPDLMRRALRYTHADVVRLRAYESNQFVCRLVANQKHPPTYSLALRFVFRYDRRPLVGRVTGFQRTTTSRYVLRWSTVPVYRQCRST